jgi:hypothetical protein
MPAVSLGGVFTIRSVFALLARGVTGFALVFVSDLPTFVLYPPPWGWTSPNDPNVVAEYMGTLPVSAFLIMVGGHFIAALAAGFVAAWIAARAKKTHALIVGLGILVAAIENLASMPHPVWFWVAEILTYAPAAYFGGMFAARIRPPVSRASTSDQTYQPAAPG